MPYKLKQMQKVVGFANSTLTSSATGSLEPGRGLDQGIAAQRALRNDSESLTMLIAPATWPSFVLHHGPDTINLDSQDSSEGQGQAASTHAAAASFHGISREENQRELGFAIAAGDVLAKACKRQWKAMTIAYQQGKLTPVRQGRVLQRGG